MSHQKPKDICSRCLSKRDLKANLAAFSRTWEMQVKKRWGHFREDLLLWTIFSHNSHFQGVVLFKKWAALSNMWCMCVEAGALIHTDSENCSGSLVRVISW